MLNGLDRFEGRSSLKTWIFRILTNIAKTRAVRDGRTLPFSALQDPARVPEAAVDADRFLDSEHPRWPGHWVVKPVAWPEERAARRRDARAAGRGDRGAARDAARRHLAARHRRLVERRGP